MENSYFKPLISARIKEFCRIFTSPDATLLLINQSRRLLTILLSIKQVLSGLCLISFTLSKGNREF